jgi:Ca2+-binding EF-hand superfamily protein
MPSEQEAIDAISSNVDINGISDTLNNPTQIFRMLDKNNDGHITNEDLRLLLEQLGINGMAANILSKYIFNQLDGNNNGTIDANDLANAGNILWNLLERKQNSGGY